MGTKRTDLQRHDLSIPGREVIQVVVELAPGVTAPAHTHPGEEIIYVIEGLWEYQVEGRPPVALKAGEVLFIPAGAVHSAKNVGSSIEHWERACHVHRRKREAAPYIGQVIPGVEKRLDVICCITRPDSRSSRSSCHTL